MNFKAIIFDLDGTLADTIPITVYAIKETVRHFMGVEMDDADVLAEFGPVDTEIVKKLVDDEKKQQAEEYYIRLFNDKFKDYVKPIDGITELMGYIKSKGIKTGLFTGRGLKVTKIVLENLNLDQYFDIVIAGDHTKKPKPDPEGIFMALDRLGVSNTESIYVGDFEADIKASKAAGTTSVLALWSSTGADELIRFEPDEYFKCPQEFIEWLERQ